jgi:serine protease inhibitor
MGQGIEWLGAGDKKAVKLFEEENMINGKVIFQIPKFSFGSSLNLLEALNSLGIKEAFTELHYAGSAPPKDEKAEMILNRPFIFAIKDNTGNVLFVGIVNNPNEK